MNRKSAVIDRDYRGTYAALFTPDLNPPAFLRLRRFHGDFKNAILERRGSSFGVHVVRERDCTSEAP
jgi:hypothetical protein